MSERPLRPRAFRLDETDLGAHAPERDRIIVQSQPDVFAAPVIDDGLPTDAEEIVEIAQKRGVVARSVMSWGGLFWGGVKSPASCGKSASARCISRSRRRGPATTGTTHAASCSI
jgi:hypothetical protein